MFLNNHSPYFRQQEPWGFQKLKGRAPSPACLVVTGVCEPRASCLTHVYPFSIPSREGPPAPNLGKCKIHLSHQGCQNWSAFPTRMMLLLQTRETGKKVQSLSSWRRRWQPTPVLLPGKSHGQRSLVGCSPWGHEELDTTERLHFHFYTLEKEMATHSSVLVWRIPGLGEPSGLPSMGSHRVGHD